MITLTIDNQTVSVEPGSTILQAAEKLGITIPTLCYNRDLPPSTSCMVCMVKLEGRDILVPACATKAEDGMKVASETDDEVITARRAALSLLLSEHTGDCTAPCQNTCPANMDIPLMIRQIQAKQHDDALITVKRDIALPAVLGRICPAPCEKACRRHDKELGPEDGPDEGVAICILKRFVADRDLAGDAPYRPDVQADIGKQAAIIGSGPAGLAAAFHLRCAGVSCTVFEQAGQLGGKLRTDVPQDLLPRSVLDAEIATIKALGVTFQTDTTVGASPTLGELQASFDAVLIATGQDDAATAAMFGIAKEDLKTDRKIRQTRIPGLFSAGHVKAHLAVRALANGKEAAVSMLQHLQGETPTGPVKIFSSRIGKLDSAEKQRFRQSASPTARIHPEGRAGDGFSEEQAILETARCLHCDCRKPVDCKLRILADQLGAQPTRRTASRRPFRQFGRPGHVLYEPGKCISCGTCIAITQQAGEALGLSFIARGFDVTVGVPFNGEIEDALTRTAQDCVDACPTGALVMDAGGAPKKNTDATD